jgi:hypothetical protein
MSKKKFKMRPCPVVGRDIPATECRDHRISRYACPADCPHNPFALANYARLLAIEHELDVKSVKRLVKEPQHSSEPGPTISRLPESDSPHAAHAFFSWQVLFKRDAAGLTCAERWQRAGFNGLRNDERVLLQARMRTRIALLEVHRVLDDVRTEAVDLLAPEAGPCVFTDRSLAATAVRFGILLGWAYPLPHFWRLSGTVILVPDMGQFEPVEIVTELVEHLGGPTTEPDLRRWLAENFVRFDDALHATSLARRQRMFANIDAHYGRAAYALQAPFQECRAVLDAVAAVEQEPPSKEEQREGFAEGRIWFAEPEEEARLAVPREAKAVLGRVLIGPTQWRIEAVGAERFSRLRGQFEAQLGARVRLTSEQSENLADRMAEQEPVLDEALVPPGLLENAGRIVIASSRLPVLPAGKSLEEAEAEIRASQDRAFLDDHVPALDGQTPREAASNPALRPKLIRLLKQRVRGQDEQNLRTGRTDDINWLLRELDVKEIIFDPPPLRPRVDLSGAAPAPDAPAERRGGRTFAALPDRPLTLEEAGARLAAVMDGFDKGEQALKELSASGSTILEAVHELTQPMLSPSEFSYLVTFLLEAWFVLVPRGAPAPDVDLEELGPSFFQEMDTFVAAIRSERPEAIMEFLKDCRQPALVQLLAMQVMRFASELPKKSRPRDHTQPILIVTLKAVINEVDRAVRG